MSNKNHATSLPNDIDKLHKIILKQTVVINTKANINFQKKLNESLCQCFFVSKKVIFLYFSF